MCMAEKQRIIGKLGEVNTYSLCTRNPIRGNQHQDAKKYCSLHEGGPNILPDVLDLRPVTRQFAKTLPNVITSGEGCKQEKDVMQFYHRSAGMFYAFRPCGIRLSHWEMFTSESLSSVFTWLVDLFPSTPDLFTFLRGIVYDRACDLKPFIRRLAKEGNSVAAEYLKLQYIVDIFHCEKHTEPKCVLGNPACEFHPHLEEFLHVRNMNTEVAEQSFNLINPFKYMTRKMAYGKRLLFFKFLDEHYNTRLLRKRSRRGSKRSREDMQ